MDNYAPSTGEWRPTFIGRGDRGSLERQIATIQPWKGTFGPWHQSESDDGGHEDEALDHPRDYISSPDLAHAVNTALLLGKPLLLTGRPGTGKTLLAERLAWELNLSPVLRFEAQSVSEAQQLFYTYDLVGRLGALQIERLRWDGRQMANGTASPPTRAASDEEVNPERFLSFGPLGRAILLGDPVANRDLLPIAYPDSVQLEARPSVVLIDEIDKASRDFPNDLLNGIGRLSFRIAELGNRLVTCRPGAAAVRPIVVITSNSERELPEPFLRRCVYFNIPEPDKTTLAAILLKRVFPESGGADSGSTDLTSARANLPRLYRQLLDFFHDFCNKQQDALGYRPGTSELIDCARALRAEPALKPEDGLRDNLEFVERRLGAIAKSPADITLLTDSLSSWTPAQA